MTSSRPEWKHIMKIAPAKLETKHSEPIVNVPPAELLSKRKHIIPVKMEAKRPGPIATALPAEGIHQKSVRATSNMQLRARKRVHISLMAMAPKMTRTTPWVKSTTPWGARKTTRGHVGRQQQEENNTRRSNRR